MRRLAIAQCRCAVAKHDRRLSNCRRSPRRLHRLCPQWPVLLHTIALVPSTNPSNNVNCANATPTKTHFVIRPIEQIAKLVGNAAIVDTGTNRTDGKFKNHIEQFVARQTNFSQRAHRWRELSTDQLISALQETHTLRQFFSSSRSAIQSTLKKQRMASRSKSPARRKHTSPVAQPARGLWGLGASIPLPSLPRIESLSSFVPPPEPQPAPLFDKNSDSIINFMFRPHTGFALIAIGALLSHLAMGEHVATLDSRDNLRRGLGAALAMFLFFALLQMRDGLLVRPHRAVWRVVKGVAVAYLLLLVFLLFQSQDDARQMFRIVDSSLGKPLPDRSYAEDCRLFTPGARRRLDTLLVLTAVS